MCKFLLTLKNEYRNIFLNGDSLVIGDLGLARKFDQIASSSKFAGTINYLSPESITEEMVVNTYSDIW
jgi:serine/threonine protein kinase